jgi:hypothetical protein
MERASTGRVETEGAPAGGPGVEEDEAVSVWRRTKSVGESGGRESGGHWGDSVSRRGGSDSYLRVPTHSLQTIQWTCS